MLKFLNEYLRGRSKFLCLTKGKLSSMNYRYRCTRRGGQYSRQGKNCGKRLTTKIQLTEKEMKEACRLCGGNLKPEPWRTARQSKCYCNAFPWSQTNGPHRKGCKWCVHYEGEYTDEDYEYQRAQHR